MTMDNAPENLNPTPPRKSYNPFESDDETLDKTGMEFEDSIGFDLKEFEECASPLNFLMDNDDSLWEEAFDKNVTVYELPEPLISKDIGVDDGANTLEKRKGDDDKNVEEDARDLKSDDNEDLHMDGLNRDVESGKCKADDPKPEVDPSNDLVDKDGDDHEDTLTKKENDKCPDKEETVLIQEPVKVETLSQLFTEQEQTTKIHPDESRNEEQTMTDSDSNISFGLNPSTNSEPRKQEDNAQNPEATKPPLRYEQQSSVTFSGPVSYAGSVSIRSESSTASTRSFAFPVLQNEWNSSPVRMAKADKRRSKAYRGWVQAFVCCRF